MASRTYRRGAQWRSLAVTWAPEPARKLGGEVSPVAWQPPHCGKNAANGCAGPCVGASGAAGSTTRSGHREAPSQQAVRPSNSRRANRAEVRRARSNVRSEEHTSELQSLIRISYAVFCLKKK